MDWKLVCTIVHIVVTLVLIVVVLFQNGKDAGLSGALTGGVDDSDSFFSKNRGKTKEGMLERLTAIMAALFIVSSLVLTIVFK